MSTNSQETPGPADASQDWRSVRERDPPPHLSGVSNTGDSNFASARSRVLGASPPASLGRVSPRSQDQASARDETSSPHSPSGLTAHIAVDTTGQRYFREHSTGFRIDLVNGEGRPIPEAVPVREPAQDHPVPVTSDPGTTSVSDPSDLTPDAGSTTTTAIDNNIAHLAQFIEGRGPNALSLNDHGDLNTIRGALITSRSHLLSTTAVVINQRKDAQENRTLLMELRDEVATQLVDLGARLDRGSYSLDSLLQENIRVLGYLGESEARIEHLLSSMASTTTRTRLPQPVLPVVTPGPFPTVINPSLMQDIEHALPSRKDDETTEEFERRARASADSKLHAASAFPLPSETPRPAGYPDHFRIDRREPVKMARFEDDPGRISSAPRIRTQPQDSISNLGGVGFGPSLSAFINNASAAGTPTVDAMEEFNLAAERILRFIIHRQVGEAPPDLGARFRAPKIDVPRKYAGANDHPEFTNWVEEITTWMNASFLGGPGAADRYRITLLKTMLSGTALQWFKDYVETRTGVSDIPYDFASIICAMHRRFVTTATAQRATRDFYAVQYKSDKGPLVLMDELRDCSSRLREPMTRSILHERFLAKIPDNIRSIMTLHRGLSAEYSTTEQLCFHSNQIWV
ncbi:hypothetical protein B0H11DRAFT_2248032 [Mycena galericulata]|nr:hypothetical protein B0H11DRAFT_2248032 [Mycena galericulata]